MIPRQLGRDAGTLALGTVVAALTGYGYLVTGTRAYGPEAFAPISIVWSAWLIAGAAFAFPAEQWLTRSLRAGATLEDLGSTMRRGAAAVVTLCTAGGLAAWLLRGTLFGSPDLAFPLVAVLLAVETAAMGAIRGTLSGRHRYGASAAVTAGENSVRLVGGLAVAAADLDIAVYAAVLLLGPLSLLWLIGSHARSSAVQPPSPPSTRGLPAVVGVSVMGQMLLNAPPVLASVAGAPGALVTATFTTMAVVRIPILLLNATAAAVTGALTDSGRDLTGLRFPFAPAGAAIVAVGGLGSVLLPTGVERVFGPGTALPGLESGVLSAGGATALVAALLTLPGIAGGAWGHIRTAWALGLAGFALTGFAAAAAGAGSVLGLGTALVGAHLVVVASLVRRPA